jgi:hypothetical protein
VLLVKLRLIRIRADEEARERTRTFEIRRVPAAAGRDIPVKRGDRHAMIYHSYLRLRFRISCVPKWNARILLLFIYFRYLSAVTVLASIEGSVDLSKTWTMDTKMVDFSCPLVW